MNSAKSKESEKKLALLPSFNVEINLARAASDASASPDIDGHLATLCQRPEKFSCLLCGFRPAHTNLNA
jgi:hypothetical protein